MSNLKPFSVAQNIHQATVQFNEKQAAELARYLHYCRSKGLVISEEKEENGRRRAMEGLLATIAETFVESDKEFCKWREKNREHPRDVVQYFQSRKIK